MPKPLVSVEGLDRAVSKIGILGTAAQARVKERLAQAAAPVVAGTRARLRSGPEVRGHIESTLKTNVRASGRRTSISVRMGGRRHPYAGFLEFGGTVVHQGARHRHGEAHIIRRPFIKEGRHLFPAARAAQAGAIDRIRSAVNDAIRDVF